MSVGKFIELSAQSAQGYEDAVRQAVERASSTIRNVRSVWAKEFEAVVENNQVTQFHVVVKIAFVLDEGTGAGSDNLDANTRVVGVTSLDLSRGMWIGASERVKLVLQERVEPGRRVFPNAHTL
jgi:hypothetical protein